jgi:dihydroorotase
MKRIIKNADVLYEGSLQKLQVLFDEEQILKVAPVIEGEYEEIDGTGLTLLPGLVDVHVHFRQPGHEEKETIHTGSLAAAHGGFTSVFAMPNVIPCPDDPEKMKTYLDLIRKESIVHTYAYGPITMKEQGKTLCDLKALKELGVAWFSDDGVGMNDPEIMKNALTLAQQEHLLIACHTEDMKYRVKGASVHAASYAQEHGWIGIPDECESEPLERDLKIAETIHGRYHACHISSHLSIEALRQAKKNHADVSGEVTAHHLLLENTDVQGTNWKMNPPLRTHADRMSLIEALEDGTLDFIASDHAPHTIADKDRPMSEAAFGIVSLETSFPLLYTEFVVKQKRWTLAQLINWMSTAPAERFGLERTGRIQEGWKSDLILVKLGEDNVIDTKKFLSKGTNTPFNGWHVQAAVKETIVSGSSVWKENV